MKSYEFKEKITTRELFDMHKATWKVKVAYESAVAFAFWKNMINKIYLMKISKDFQKMYKVKEKWKNELHKTDTKCNI